MSAVCTHLDCHVGWNDAEASWDRPCHGSRVDRDGDLLATQAVENFQTYTEADLRDLGVRVDRR